MNRSRAVRSSSCRSAARTLAPLLAAALAALLSACAVGPEYRTITPHEALPDHFPHESAAAAPVAQPDEWWRGFGDEGLDALVAAALRNSPDLASAEANIRQARAGVDEVAGARALQLDAQARAGRDRFSRNSENFANIPFPNPKTSFDDYRAGLDASWEIDLFGHTTRALQAASARAEGLEWQRTDLALRIAAETARNVLDYRHARLRLANANRAVQAQRELLELVRQQRDAGVAADSDVKQAEIALSNAVAVVAPLESASRASAAALLPLTAWTESQVSAALGDADPAPTLPQARSFTLHSTVLQQRPDVRASERALAAATADVGVAMADRYPRFTLVGDAGWDSIRAGSLLSRASEFWNFGPQLYVPLLTGGRVSARIRSQEAARDAALANYRKAVLAGLADIEAAMLRCQGDDGRLAQADAAARLQREQVELSALRVGAGDSPRLDLLAARIQLAALVDQQLVSSQALSDDLVLLHKALGGSVPAAQ